MKNPKLVSLFAVTLALVAGPRVQAQGRQGGVELSSARDQAAALANESVGGPFTALCTSSAAFGSNVMANCDSKLLPHNETAISVEPNNPNHLVAGSNDTELPPSGAPGAAKSVAGYYTSFNGGATWLNGQVPPGSFTQTADPTIGFDTRGNIYYGVVAFDLGLGGQALGGAIQVSRSSDGGQTFETPVTVEESTSDAIFEDKPYLVVDTNPGSPFLNSVYIVWTRFHFNSADSYLESPIFFSASRDGGRTWLSPMEISGNNRAVCTFSGTPLPYDGRCKGNQFCWLVVGAECTLSRAFEHGQRLNDGNFRSQYLVVKSSDGGTTWNPPVRASDIIRDGVSDYPINVNGRQTLSNSQFRVNSAGNLSIDPTRGTLFVVWSDNRNGTATDTNTDVFIASSSDGGATWSSPRDIALSGDQFYPW